MTPIEYLKKLLEDQAIPEQSKREMENDRARIEKDINAIPDLPNPTYYYGGSKAKNTMIKEAFDLDLVIYYPEETQKAVKDLYWMVFAQMQSRGYKPVQKNVAIRVVKRDDYHIDIVPGKRIANDPDFAYIFKSQVGERLKTSLSSHVEVISKCARRDVLKLLKLWKVRNSLEIPSFVLELIAIKALDGIPERTPLHDTMASVFGFIAQHIETIRLEDPANSANILSSEDNIPSSNKSAVAEAARWSTEENDLQLDTGWQTVYLPKDVPPRRNTSTSSKGSVKEPRLSPDSPGRRFA